MSRLLYLDTTLYRSEISREHKRNQLRKVIEKIDDRHDDIYFKLLISRKNVETVQILIIVIMPIENI